MKPDYHNTEEFQTRLQKLKEIRSLGVNPYPYQYNVATSLESILEEFQENCSYTAEQAEQKTTPFVRASGRLVLFRAMGKNAFAHIQDDTGKLQLMFNRDHTKVSDLDVEKAEIKPLKFIEKKLDLGDIIGIEGHMFRTRKNELTIYVTKITLLSKALLPLPDKHAGLQDKGVRYQKRWLDLIATQQTMQRLKMRSHIVRWIRLFMDQNAFLEVETPILQKTYGGAEASPFTTTLQANHKQMYLRIALEISLKKLLVGGIPRIYEIGKNFRNEGIDKTHNPEFTMLEAYATGWDYNDMMDFVEKLFATIAEKLFGTKTLSYQNAAGECIDISLQQPWKKMTMKESINHYAKIDFDALSTEQLRQKLEEKNPSLNKDIENASRGSLMAYIFEQFVEEHLLQPHHIIDHPVETTPFCKPHRDPQKNQEGLVERFESFILGTEMINAYSELNDPELQRSLLEKQRDSRSQEVYPIDEEFIEAICQGMPPAAGIGIGIDRLVMLFTNTCSIKDVLFFPL